MLPVTALGLRKGDVPMPLGAHQALSLEDESDVRQLFRDLRIAVADASHFCASVKKFAENVEHVPNESVSSGLEAVLEMARAKQAALDFEESLSTPAGRRAVQGLVVQLFQALQSATDRANAAEPGLRFRTEKNEDQLVIQGARHSLSFVFENRSPNSVNEIVIYAIEVEGRLSLPSERHYGGESGTTNLSTIHYSLGFDEAGFLRWVEQGTHISRGSTELAEYWVSELVRHTYELE
jgi:hypothetical protein